MKQKKMEHSDSVSSFTLSNLLCQEKEACFDEDVVEDVFLTLNNFNLSESEDEYIEMLVERESSFGTKIHGSSSDDCFTTLGNWLKCARLDAIRWILKTRAFFGFRYHTAYLSVTYFDRFLSKRVIDCGKSWAIPLLSVTCLSLAAKMEEYRAPALSEFEAEEYKFESKMIQKMELLVLNTLQWRLSSITPFDYLHYFLNKFCDKKSQSNRIASRAVELIFAMTKDTELNSMDHRPSVITAAAVLAALDHRLTRKTVELKMSLISSYGSLENELEMGKSKMPKLANSPDESPIYSNPADVFEDLCYKSVVGSKRRRLSFNDCDQNCGKPNEKRLR
ncbi:hypothetical protein HHK36_002741 [Tetracentron sinense]|uniref:Cyclin-like domain-containing protein n=1 Tax=Tetracentron sinense TaxID=13715 RepID=A0A835DN15_TETSI|nr:hypothetical protein HHK36_002741 [Tetracentron sinense]